MISPKQITTLAAAVTTAGLGTIISMVWVYQQFFVVPEIKAQSDTIIQQHMDLSMTLGPSLQSQTKLIEEGNRIACSDCKNNADTVEEAKRCNCKSE